LTGSRVDDANHARLAVTRDGAEEVDRISVVQRDLESGAARADLGSDDSARLIRARVAEAALRDIVGDAGELERDGIALRSPNIVRGERKAGTDRNVKVRGGTKSDQAGSEQGCGAHCQG